MVDDETAPDARLGLLSLPNPFRQSAEIHFDLPSAGVYEVAIFDITGRKITGYRANGSAGDNVVHWDGRDQSGARVGSGVYYYRLRANGQSETKKMLLLK